MTYPCILYPRGGRLPERLLIRREDLVHAAHKKSGVTRKAAEEALKAFLEVLTERMKERDKIELRGHFTMIPWRTKYRPGRNPRNGDLVGIVPTWTAKVRFPKGYLDRDEE